MAIWAPRFFWQTREHIQTVGVLAGNLELSADHPLEDKVRES